MNECVKIECLCAGCVQMKTVLNWRAQRKRINLSCLKFTRTNFTNEAKKIENLKNANQFNSFVVLQLSQCK